MVLSMEGQGFRISSFPTRLSATSFPFSSTTAASIRIFFDGSDKRSNRRRRRVKNGDSVIFDQLPKTIRFRPIWSSFVHHNRRPVAERSVHDVAVAGDPTDVCATPINIFLL